ncbi:MAG: serine acetyltransferase [Kiritimatiellae bacterium]|nr:serine acetyltransferase [Kiritimatiellia bacterium]
MELNKELRDRMPQIISELSHCWHCPIGANTEKGLNLAGQRAVHSVLEDLISVLFPGCHGHEPVQDSFLIQYLQEQFESAIDRLRDQMLRAFQYQCSVVECKDCHDCKAQSDEAIEHIVNSLPQVQKILQSDINAAYEGDPAARSTMEIVMSYPGVYAVIVHRVAHLLYEKDVPLIPRVMSEHAHSLTGIDIHPGAQIGQGFFIDHGTGVVIGETCVIGQNVKLYQGVTLGAMSFERDPEGNLVKGIKRHPNVGDHVVIYAGATILGGDTTIGEHAVIGGNVWLTHSVPPKAKVHNQQPKPLIREKDGSWRTADGPWNDIGGGI